MRPIRGIVIGAAGQTLDIKLESGRIIHMPKVHGLNVGKKVLVTYDFTKNKAREVLPDERHARFAEVKVEEPTPVVESGEVDDSDADDGYWRLIDSGILELSEPDSGGCGGHDPQAV